MFRPKEEPGKKAGRLGVWPQHGLFSTPGLLCRLGICYNDHTRPVLDYPCCRQLQVSNAIKALRRHACEPQSAHQPPWTQEACAQASP